MRVKEDPKPSPKMSRKLKPGVSCFHAWRNSCQVTMSNELMAIRINGICKAY
jgi:hypothetical protein